MHSSAESSAINGLTRTPHTDDGESAEVHTASSPPLESCNASSPKDAVFSTPELLLLIFRMLVHISEDSGKLQRNNAVSASQVCKAFHGPALNFIWETLDDLMPLLKLLPNFKLYDETYYYHGDIRPQAEENIHFHDIARLVRFITIRPTDEALVGDRVSPSVAVRLASQLSERGLCPNLHTLRFNGVSHRMFSIIPLLLNPTTHSITISRSSEHGNSGIAMNDFTEGTLRLMPHDCSLGELSFSDLGFSPSEFFWKTVRTAPCSRKLTKLSATTRDPPSTTEVKLLLEQIPSLNAVSFCAASLDQDARQNQHDTHMPWERQLGGHRSRAIPSSARLHSFSVTLPVPHNFTQYGFQARVVYLPDVTSLRIKVPEPGPQDSSVQTILEMLSGTIGKFKFLQTLVLGGDWQTGVGVRSPWTTNNIRPILTSSTLLNFSLNATYLGTTSGFQSNSLDWIPESPLAVEGGVLPLQTLTLPPGYNLSITNLISFTKTSKSQIQELKVGIDSSNAAELAAHVPPSQHSALRTLHVYDNRGTPFTPMEYSTIAERLVDAFPNLQEVKPYRGVWVSDPRGFYGKFDDWEFIGHLCKKFRLLKVALSS